MYKFAFQVVFPFSFSLLLRLPSFTISGGKRLLCTCEFRLPAFYLPTHRKGGKREGVCDGLTDEKVEVAYLFEVM